MYNWNMLYSVDAFAVHAVLQPTASTTIVLRPFVWDYPIEMIPEETFTQPPS